MFQKNEVNCDNYTLLHNDTRHYLYIIISSNKLFIIHKYFPLYNHKKKSINIENFVQQWPCWQLSSFFVLTVSGIANAFYCFKSADEKCLFLQMRLNISEMASKCITNKKWYIIMYLTYISIEFMLFVLIFCFIIQPDCEFQW